MSNVISSPETWFTPPEGTPTTPRETETPQSLRTLQTLSTTPQRLSTRRLSGWTNTFVWLLGGICRIDAVLLTMFIIGTLIVYLNDKPRVSGVLNVSRGSLNNIYFDDFRNIYGNVNLIFNFRNPTRNHPATLESIRLELMFKDTGIAERDLSTYR
ncbi:unnamed protein product [Arabis nemorensis]|uniref:Late embryogenesis abundant protein LEA-2 subgroup domain-containing protein n=1 Tax=Arabis nemorensis TaxID=586526 RepID=A0A565BW01_9BRAS|nr:unnamed protein product [Arabis nemorensis]